MDAELTLEVRSAMAVEVYKALARFFHETRDACIFQGSIRGKSRERFEHCRVLEVLS